MRNKTGGGTRKIKVCKDTDAKIIMEEATKLYFPEENQREAVS